jgi:uncharacterized protein YbjT (DUF2867 family)
MNNGQNSFYSGHRRAPSCGFHVSHTAIAFGEPERYRGQIMEIAGDELTFTQMAEVLQKVLERPVHYQTRTIEQDQGLDGARKASEFFEREGYKADIVSLRQIRPQLLSFETFAISSNGSK